MPASRLQSLLPLLVCFALIGAVYAPFLFEGYVQIHGDGVAFSVPMLQLLKSSLARGELPFWTELAYGGHPVFAEGQIGALNPLNVLVAALFAPIIGHTVYHLLAMLISAAGAFALARRLGTSATAAGVCAVSLALSPLWLGTQNNLTISAASMCVPWLLWAFERWLATLRHADAALFGLVCALMIFSGYPQIVHGSAIYLAVRGSVALAEPADRARLLARPGHSALGLGLMLLLAALIAAAQLLPLAELAGQSYRKDGVAFSEAPGGWYLRGLLYSLYDPADAAFRAGPDSATAQAFHHFNFAGSVAVCMLAGANLLFYRGRHVLAHLAATFLLLNLGFSSHSPLWRFLHAHELLPGMDMFRIMSPYFNVAMVGLALLTALGVDRLTRTPLTRRQGLLLVAMGLGWALLVQRSYSASVSPWQFAAPAVIILALLLRQRVVALPLAGIVLAALSLEVLALRLHPFAFHAPELLQRPASADLYAGERQQLLRHFDGSVLVLYAQQNALSERVPTGLHNALDALTPTGNVLWGVASMHGGMGLDLARRKLIEPAMIAELSDPATRQSGTRLIDTLSVGFVTAGAIVEPRGMPLAYHSADGVVAIFANPSAMPKLRTYTKARAVASAPQALAAMDTTAPDTLVLECAHADCAELPPVAGDGEIRFRVSKQTPTRLRVDIEAARAGWFFTADANYPGWIATLDGDTVPVLSAQVLGKAVAFGPGAHRLELRFEPRSVRIGLWLSAAGLLIALSLLAAGRAADARI